MKKILIIVFLLLGLVLIVLGFGGYRFNLTNEDTPSVCTEEAKQCPDGSYVGRTGPSCEFEACP